MGRSPSTSGDGLKKGPWSPEEDQLLIDFIDKHGHGSWQALPKRAGLNRCGKSCRLRWSNYLRPDIKRGRFSDEEEKSILSLHSIHGNKWSTIASHLPGRTDNEIKNYWNTHLRKKLIRSGLDPLTHRPLLIHHDFNLLSSLSQLQSILNLCHLLNPLLADSTTIGLQAHQHNNNNNAIDASRIQLLQCVLPTAEVINNIIAATTINFQENSSPRIGGGSSSSTQFPQQLLSSPLNGTSTLCYTGPDPSHRGVPITNNVGVIEQLKSHNDNNAMVLSGDTYYPQNIDNNDGVKGFGSTNSSSCNAPPAGEYTLPQLVEATHPLTYNLNLDQTDSNISNLIIPTIDDAIDDSNIFDSLESIVDSSEANSFFWREHTQ